MISVHIRVAQYISPVVQQRYTMCHQVDLAALETEELFKLSQSDDHTRKLPR